MKRIVGDAMHKNFLAVGTVVKVKNYNGKVTIVGYFIENNNVFYDYVAFPFPNGYIGNDNIICFNDNEIEQICYSGFEFSEEQKRFKGDLVSEYNSIMSIRNKNENNKNVVMPVFTPLS